jgi:subtilisin family serine protease
VCRSRALAFSRAVLLVVAAGLGALLTIGSAGALTLWDLPRSTRESRPVYVPNQVLVKFKAGISSDRKEGTAWEADANAVLGTIGPQGHKDTLLLGLDPTKTSVEEAVRKLLRSTDVLYAEPDYTGQLLFTPADPDFPDQWGLCNTGQEVGGVAGTPGADINATRAWDLEQGYTNPVTVAVLDSGINPAHEDLQSQIWTNGDEVSGNKVDDDGNGYVDDVNGYNWTGISQQSYTYFSGGTWQPMYREFGTGADTQGFAQLIVGTGCDLTHVGVMLSKVNNPTGDITVSIRTDLGGSDICSFVVSPADVADSPTEIYRPLSTSIVLQSGATYHIVVTTSNADATNHFRIYDYQAAKTGWFAYWDGYESAWDGSSWVAAASSDDLYFRTNPNPNPYDDNSHGTQVSGVIAAEHNNKGIAGVSPGSRIMPLKITDSSGAITTADLCDALFYAADNGARVINMSLKSPFSSAVQDAINYAHDKGAVLFAAAGNDGNANIWYPAGYENVVGVGATTNKDEKASFSNYNASVDVTAPGQDIYTTHRSGGYVSVSGTSLAAPHAAGLAALVLSARPAYTPLRVERALENYANDLGAPGRDDNFGFGRINAYATIKGALTPEIKTLDPSCGPTNSDLTIDGDGFGNTDGGSWVTVGSSRAQIKSWANQRIVCVVPGGLSGRVPVTVTNDMGTSAAVDFEVTFPTWYLAEGSTAWGFQTVISIENPNSSDNRARVTFLLSDGTSKVRTVTLPRMSQTTIDPKEDLGERDFSTKVECLEGKNIAVDRTVRWSSGHGNDVGEHCSIGVTSPAKTWYLPEGSSAWGFECWLLVQNPNHAEARCQITYMREGASPVTFNKVIQHHSRASFNMADDIGPSDASIRIDSDVPVVTERAMYSHWVTPETGSMVRREGHESIGTTTPATDYYLAEGSTAWGFTTYVLVQNPNKAPTNVALIYMTDKGAIQDKPFTMPPESRKTIRLNDRLPNTDASTRVHSDRPIIVERAMYWGVTSVQNAGLAMHDSIGIPAPHSIFYLPDGEVSPEPGGAETFTLVQNPNASDVKVRVSYLTPSGKSNVAFTDTVKACSRKTFNMGERFSKTRASTVVECITSGKKIIVERSMYVNGRWGGTNTIGAFLD